MHEKHDLAGVNICLLISRDFFDRFVRLWAGHLLLGFVAQQLSLLVSKIDTHNYRVMFAGECPKGLRTGVLVKGGQYTRRDFRHLSQQRRPDTSICTTRFFLLTLNCARWAKYWLFGASTQYSAMKTTMTVDDFHLWSRVLTAFSVLTSRVFCVCRSPTWWWRARQMTSRRARRCCCGAGAQWRDTPASRSRTFPRPGAMGAPSSPLYTDTGENTGHNSALHLAPGRARLKEGRPGAVRNACVILVGPSPHPGSYLKWCLAVLCQDH